MTKKVTRSPDISSLLMALKPGQLITNPIELLTYEYDAALDKAVPDGVAYPESTEDVNRILAWAADHHTPVIPWGAGTGLAGGVVAESGGLVLHFSRMNRILELDRVGRSAIIEPGLVNVKLDDDVRQVGLFYPPDPASGRVSTLGGNIAVNAGGPHCFKYGVTTNYITGLEIVRSNGQTTRLGGRAFDYPEYDFVGLLTGSEGTLGIVTKAFIRLLRNPPSVQTIMAAFNTVKEAGEAVSALISQGLVPATMEFMDQKMIRMIEQFSAAGLPVDAGAALIIEVDGYPQSLQTQVHEIIATLEIKHVVDIRIAQNEEEREKIWYGRKSAAGAMSRLAPAYLTLDGTVPRSKLAETLEMINEICTQHELQVAYVFHAGDGNLHPFLLIEDLQDKELMERVHRAGFEIMQTCVDQNGSITGEHGVGIEKRKYMLLMYGKDELSAMLDIKSIFDPLGILNPGKIFPKIDTEHQNLTKDNLTPPPSFPQVVSPHTALSARQMIQSCFAQNATIYIRGGSTKSCYPSGDGYLLDTGNLSGIINYAPEDLYVTIGAGTRLSILQKILEKDNMWVPIESPWEQSTIGGIIATNFNSPLRMRFGSLRDLVLALHVLLPDGRMIRIGRPIVKNVAGYDMPKLFIGSYGTLGLITEATLKLVPLPRTRATILVPFEDLQPAIESAMKLLQVCLVCSALILCKDCGPLQDAPYTLIYSAEGFAEDVDAELNQVGIVLENMGIAEFNRENFLTGSSIWREWVKNCHSVETETVDQKSLFRIGVPPKDMQSLLKQDSILDCSSFIADIPNGLLYILNSGEISLLQNHACLHGGYAVRLSGPTQLSQHAERWYHTPESLDLMRALKSRWDPQGLFNPEAFLL